MSPDFKHSNSNDILESTIPRKLATPKPIAITVRLLAGALVLSGIPFSLIAWVTPFFWPGYFIWVVWLYIALGYKRLNKQWFWLVSTIWNFSILMVFLFVVEFSIKTLSPIECLPLLHSVIACLLSITIIIYFRNSFKINE